jgi:hypothetical protein
LASKAGWENDPAIAPILLLGNTFFSLNPQCNFAYSLDQNIDELDSRI